MQLLLSIVNQILMIYYYLLIARILMSWVPSVQDTSLGRILFRLTEPYLAVFRKIIPPLSIGPGAIDFSPIVALIAYSFLERGIYALIGMIPGF